MNAKHSPQTFSTEFPTLSPEEVRRIIQDAERMRAEHLAGLLRSAARGVARLARAMLKPPAIPHADAAAHDPFRPQPRLN